LADLTEIFNANLTLLKAKENWFWGTKERTLILIVEY